MKKIDWELTLGILALVLFVIPGTILVCTLSIMYLLGIL